MLFYRKKNTNLTVSLVDFLLGRWQAQFWLNCYVHFDFKSTNRLIYKQMGFEIPLKCTFFDFLLQDMVPKQEGMEWPSLTEIVHWCQSIQVWGFYFKI